MKSILDILKNIVSALAGGTGKTLSVYGKIVRGYTKFFLVASTCLLVLPTVGFIFKMHWLVSIYAATLGILLVVGLIILLPVLVLAKAASDHIGPFRKIAVLITSFLFWILAIAIYFLVVPVANFATLILVVFVFGLMALAYAAFGIRTSPKLMFVLAIIILIAVSSSSLFPNSKTNLINAFRFLDKTITSLITPAPKKVDIQSFYPFDPKDGKVRVWYCKDPSGKYEFYDGPGYHWSGVPLQEITPQVVADYLESLAPKPDMTPNKVEISSYSPFDSVSGKPRVWYYKDPAGQYEFYDKPGFHWSGEALKIITPQVVDDWKKMEEKKKRDEQEAQRLEAEHQLQLRAEAEKIESERLAESQKRAESEWLAAQKAKEQLAENTVPTPIPTPEWATKPTPIPIVVPPIQATIQPSWERVYQVWIDQNMSLREISSALKKATDSMQPMRRKFRFAERTNIVRKPMRLVAFSRSMTTQEVCSYFDEQRINPATFNEIMFLSAEYPEISTQFPVVALGPACGEHDYGHERTYYTSNFDGKTEADRIVSNWDKNTRFASVLR